jgi:1,4-dihydroxy-2-naphthoyl-CoA hydrolase
MTAAPPDLTDLNDLNLAPGQFLRGLGLRVTEATATLVRAELDATEEHHTPWGIVHGGVYSAAIESAASIGASIAVQGAGRFAVGLDNVTDFVRAHRSGRLHVLAEAVHQGRTGQLWTAEITRDDGKTIARGRVRLQNVDLPG